MGYNPLVQPVAGGYTSIAGNLDVTGDANLGVSTTAFIQALSAARMDLGFSFGPSIVNGDLLLDPAVASLVAVDTSGGPVTITLPTVGVNSGTQFIIYDYNGSAATNNITIDVEGGGLVDGAVTRVINSNYAAVMVHYKGGGDYAATGEAGAGAGTLTALTDVDVSAAVDGSLFRFDTGTSLWEATTAANLLLDDAGALLLPQQGLGTGLLLGGDADLYRSAANRLRTSGHLTVDGSATVDTGMTVTAGGVTVTAGGASVAGGILITSSGLNVAAGSITAAGLNHSLSGRTTMQAMRTGIIDVIADHTWNWDDEHTFLVDDSGGDVNIELNALSGAGSVVVVKKIAGGNNTTVTSVGGSGNIEGITPFPVLLGEAFRLQFDGTDWWVIA